MGAEAEPCESGERKRKRHAASGITNGAVSPFLQMYFQAKPCQGVYIEANG